MRVSVAAPRRGAHPAKTSLAAAVLALWSLAVPAPAETLHVPGKVSEVVPCDLDGAWPRELLVSYAEQGARYLAIFEARGGEYADTATRTILVKPDAIAYSVGRFGRSDDERSLALLARGGVYRYPFRDADPDAGIERLLACELFFLAPKRKLFPVWPPARGRSGAGAVDVNGDGLDDLLIPERGRLRIAYQAREGEESRFAREETLPIAFYFPELSEGDRVRARFDRLFARERARPFVSTLGEYPFPELVDFDGDGRLDIAVLVPGRILEIWRQAEDGAFARRPAWRIPAPWSKRALAARFIDLDGDGWKDLVLHRVPKVTYSEVLVFLVDGAAVAESFETPSQLLRVDGIFARFAVADGNADGRNDLMLPSYRLDLLEGATRGRVEEIEINHLVYAGESGGLFARRPSHRRRFTIATSSLRGDTRHPHVISGEDCTGDGSPDLVQVDSDGRLRVYRGAGGASFEFEELRVFQEPIGQPAAIELWELDGEAGSEIVLSYRRDVRIRRPAR